MQIKKASQWTLATHIVVQLLKFASNLILTRLLAQDAFGLIAVANVILFGFALLSDTGIFQVLVTNARAESPAFRNTAWTVQVLRGAFLGSLALAAAGILHAANGLVPQWLGGTYGDPRLPGILAALGLSPFIQGFKPTKYIFALKALKIKEITQATLSAQIVGSAVTISLSYAFHSVWALVVGALVASLCEVLFCRWFLEGRIDAFAWDRSCLKEIFGLSRWIMLTSVTGFFVSGGDRLFLAGLLDSSTLGQYAIAFMLLSVAVGLQEKLMGAVAFPALSAASAQGLDPLRAAYSKFQKLTDGLVFFGAGVGCLAGASLVNLLYGGRYHETAWMFSALSITLVATRFQPVEQCYIANGFAHLTVFKNLLMIAALYAGVHLGFDVAGVRGAVWGVVLAPFAAWPVALYVGLKLRLPLWRSAVVAPVALGAGAAVGWGVDRLLTSLGH